MGGRGGKSADRDGTSACRGGTSAGRGWTSAGAGRASVSPRPTGGSGGVGLLASTLASAARARASADFWPDGFFSVMPVSVLVCLRGRNVLASFAALGTG